MSNEARKCIFLTTKGKRCQNLGYTHRVDGTLIYEKGCVAHMRYSEPNQQCIRRYNNRKCINVSIKGSSSCQECIDNTEKCPIYLEPKKTVKRIWVEREYIFCSFFNVSGKQCGHRILKSLGACALHQHYLKKGQICIRYKSDKKRCSNIAVFETFLCAECINIKVAREIHEESTKDFIDRDKTFSERCIAYLAQYHVERDPRRERKILDIASERAIYWLSAHERARRKSTNKSSYRSQKHKTYDAHPSCEGAIVNDHMGWGNHRTSKIGLDYYELYPQT